MRACTSNLSNDKIYPEVIPSAPSEDLRTMNGIIEKEKDKQKMIHISNKIKMIEKDLKHYRKARKRWKVFKTISKISSFIIFAGIEISSGILIFVPGTGIIVPLILAGSGAVEVFAEEGLDKLIQKRCKNMDSKIIKCRSVLDKLFLFLEEAKKDKIIDASELEIFKKIINDYYSTNKNELNSFPVSNDKEEMKI